MPDGTLVNGRYLLDRLPLARGGMGDVYGGRDVALDRGVAVKLIHFSHITPSDEMVRRFLRESLMTARLQHPGVPAIYDVGTHNGWPYLVMQKINGITVADLIAESGALPIGWAAAIAAQVCATLAAAHEASLIHRDLKPSNLMVEPSGGVKVLDFGLAVAFDAAQFSTITGTGQSVGTPAYMAPEQVNATAIGPKTDLYALGCTLHEMLTGAAAFSGSSPYAVMSKQVNEHPRPVRELRPDVPPELEQLVRELLEKDAGHRPANAAAVYQRLLPFVTDLRPLPQIASATSGHNATGMYATVLSRVVNGDTLMTPVAGHLAVDAIGLPAPAPAVPAWGVSAWPGHAFAPPQVAANGSGHLRPAALAHNATYSTGAIPYPPSAGMALLAHASNGAGPSGSATFGWRLRHSLWLLFAALGFGCLAGVGMIYVGVRARRPAWWILGVVYTIAGWAMFALVGISGPTGAASNWGVGGLLLVWIGSTLHSALINPAWLRWLGQRPRWVVAQAAPQPMYPPVVNPASVARSQPPAAP